MPSASVLELAVDWLTAKRALEPAAQAEKGHSDRARRADLERRAVVLGEVRGRSPTADRRDPQHDFEQADEIAAMIRFERSS